MNQRISALETQRLLRHAYAAEKELGGTQDTIAKFLDVTHQRVSEGLKANWTLMPSQARSIIDKFGQPRHASGLYVVAESYNSIANFKNEFGAVSTKRFSYRLVELFYSNEMKEYIASFMPDKENENTVIEKLERLDKVVSHSEIKTWVNNKIKNADEFIKIPAFLSEQFYAHTSEDELDFIFSLCYLRHELWPEFSFVNKNYAYKRLIEEREFVLTGDIVLDTHISTNHLAVNSHVLPSLPLVADEFELSRVLYSSSIKYKIDELNILRKPDEFNSATVQLFLNDAMKYNLLILLHHDNHHLPHKADRQIIIRDLGRSSIFDDINDLLCWMGESWDSSFQLKSKIASLGGYIPGAKIL